MVKVSSGDALAVLRRFNVATDEHTPRFIEQLRFSHPLPINTLISFRFQKQQYYLIFDDTAADNYDYIIEQIGTDKGDIQGELYENPLDSVATYALPFKGKDVYLFKVTSSHSRLDQELARRYPETSRSIWQKHIKAGHVSVNGEDATSPKQAVTQVDDIAVSLPDAPDHDEKSLPIVYIDDNVIVVNKPIGILTHSKGALNDEFTVADFFRRYTTWGLDTNRPGIIHRLDRDTSGLIIGARNQETAESLKKQFSDRTTKKTYLAIVTGQLKLKTAKIDVPIGRNPSKPSTFRADPKGKPAETSYQVLAEADKLSLVRLQPRTGRTHQLRVHMLYLAAPILGDRVYGKEADRLYLHAQKLEVTLPGGNRTTFDAPVPEDFKTIFPEAANL